MASTLPTGDEHVLVVDDDAAIRLAMTRLLRGLGYRVTEAAGGEAALATVDAGQQIDLLLTDIQMPGMSGDQLARQVQALRPGVRVLYVSGDHTLAHYGSGFSERTSHFLAKPFDASELAARIRAVLEG